MIDETAFNCPHCGALAKQFWHSVNASELKDSATPQVLNQADFEEFMNRDLPKDEPSQSLVDWVSNMASGRPFLHRTSDSIYARYELRNLSVSRCFNCKDIAIWIYENVVYPTTGEAPAANPDMPASVRIDYDEASTILGMSPRGAAALIRLAIQKLCIELGQTGKNLNLDISNLVQSGLDTRVQQSLDAVRVIGNNAVHPGQIDLNDNRGVAESLFKLTNLIVDKTISEPKLVQSVYDSLPESNLKQIRKRDGGRENN